MALARLRHHMWIYIGNWVRGNRVLLTNVMWLVGTTVVTSGLGAIFWVTAARTFPVASVGLGSAAISAMTLLSQLGIIGFGTLLIGELPRRRENRTSLIATAAVIVGPVTGLLGLLFSLVAPHFFTNLGALGDSVGSAALFTAGVSIAGVALLLDHAVVGLLRGDLQFRRNLILSTSKLGALWLSVLLTANTTGMGIYATWVFGNIASLVYLGAVALQRGHPLATYYPRLSLMDGLKRSTLWHHALNLGLQIPGLTMPLIVVVVMSASMNAYFGVSWMLASFAFLMPSTLTTVLYAVGTAQPELLAQKMRLTLALSGVVGTLATAMLAGGSNQLLGLFGHLYAEHARLTLVLLSAGVFPLIIKTHFVAICRIRGQIARTALLLIGCCVLELTAATLGASIAGLPGISLAWLTAVSVEASLMASTIYHAARLHPKLVAGRSDSLNSREKLEDHIEVV